MVGPMQIFMWTYLEWIVNSTWINIRRSLRLRCSLHLTMAHSFRSFRAKGLLKNTNIASYITIIKKLPLWMVARHFLDKPFFVKDESCSILQCALIPLYVVLHSWLALMAVRSVKENIFFTITTSYISRLVC